MNIIKAILNGVEKIQDVVKVVKAVLAGVEAFTNSLKGEVDDENK